MSDRLAALLLPPLILLGFMLRQGAAAREEIADSAATGGLSSPLRGADSAWQARRVFLTLSSGRLPQSDRHLSHPQATPLAELPLFPAVLATSGRLVLGKQASGRGGGDIPNERRLETFLAEIGPALTLLLLLFGLAAARRGASRSAGTRAGLMSVALLVFTPVALRLGAVGVLSVELWCAVLFLVQAGFCRSAWCGKEGLDRLQAALFAGFVTGLGLASSPLFAIPALAAWSGFLVAAWSASDDRARDRARDGLMFCVGAFLPTQLPNMDGPWQAAPAGPVLEWIQLASGSLIVACLPLAVAFFRIGARLRSSRAAGALVAASAVALALSPLIPIASLRALRSSLGLLRWEASGGMRWDTFDLAAPLPELLPLVLLLVAALWFGRRDRPRAESAYFIVAGVLCVGAALLTESAAVMLLVPTALALDAYWCGAWGASVRGERRRVAALVAIVLSVGAAISVGELRTARAGGEQPEVVRALRWLRAHSESSGAWYSAGTGQSYAVLAEAELAAQVPYHARRPALGVGPRAAGDPRGLARALAVLAAEEPAELVRGAVSLGARYLVVRPSDDDRALLGPAARALAEARAPIPPGAQRVYPPGEVEGTPPVTIYLLERPRIDQPGSINATRVR